MDGNRALLRVRRVSERDYGKYECSAHNNEGTAVGEVELTGEIENTYQVCFASRAKVVQWRRNSSVSHSTD